MPGKTWMPFLSQSQENVRGRVMEHPTDCSQRTTCCPVTRVIVAHHLGPMKPSISVRLASRETSLDTCHSKDYILPGGLCGPKGNLLHARVGSSCLLKPN